MRGRRGALPVETCETGGVARTSASESGASSSASPFLPHRPVTLGPAHSCHPGQQQSTNRLGRRGNTSRQAPSHSNKPISIVNPTTPAATAMMVRSGPAVMTRGVVPSSDPKYSLRTVDGEERSRDETELILHSSVWYGNAES